MDKLYLPKLYDEVSERATALVTPYGHNTEQSHSRKAISQDILQTSINKRLIQMV